MDINFESADAVSNAQVEYMGILGHIFGNKTCIDSLDGMREVN